MTKDFFCGMPLVFASMRKADCISLGNADQSTLMSVQTSDTHLSGISTDWIKHRPVLSRPVRTGSMDQYQSEDSFVSCVNLNQNWDILNPSQNQCVLCLPKSK